jgi:hypothetical protein
LYSSDLEKILEILQRIASSKLRTRFLKPEEHQGDIVRCKEMLDQAFKVFNVGHLLHMLSPWLNTIQVDATIGIRLEINEINRKLAVSAF